MGDRRSEPDRQRLASLFILCSLPPAQAVFGLTSYANLFFQPTDVLNNTWFAQSYWAQDMAAYWAGQLIPLGPWSVTNKTILPRSNDAHDYYSLAVYYWPDCSNAGNTTQLTDQQIWNQCEYYQRDGVFNPDIELVKDSDAFQNLTDSVYLASLAYAATSSSVYSQHINDAMYTFFVDNSTKMNANLDYSQVIRGPGNQTGRHIGVLDLKPITKAVSAVELVRASGSVAWTAATDQGMRSWASEMLNWLQTSEFGLQERAEANNHATFYYNSICSLQVLLGNYDGCKAALNQFYNSTFLGQIDANGDQPYESVRTRPYHYRAYNLAALVVNARIGDYIGLQPSAWNRTSGNGTTIFEALHFAMAQDPLAHNETDAIAELNPMVAAVASRFGDPNAKYVNFLHSTDPYYPGQPYYALSSGLGDDGMKQGLIQTTYSARSAQPTARRRSRARRGIDEG